MKLRLGLPKGSLQEATLALFRKAGYEFRANSSRSYHPTSDDPEVDALLIRPQEIPRYVENGILDAGLTGKDWIEDNGSDVVEVAEFVYSKATLDPIRVVMAVSADSPYASVADLSGKRIATEYLRLTERYLEAQGVKASVEFSWGACEIKVPELVDAIVVNTETGSSLRAHNLRVLDTILTSTTRLIAGRQSWQDEWKRAKIENLSMLLRGALNAEQLVGLKMNVPRAALAEVYGILPALRRPTVSPLADDHWVALEIIVEERVVRDLIPRLKRAGGEGLVEYPLNKVIY
ncbi:MAG TPA: ATP phosphoribosyltransferase [Chthonomonadales bacterium]|nr:ATP phosphoribosyltransferase [Chthonomonadales bacterium]